MADEHSKCVGREEFLALAEQVKLIAKVLDERDRFENPDGPNGWQLRKTTVIKERVEEILDQQKGQSADEPSSKSMSA